MKTIIKSGAESGLHQGVRRYISEAKLKHTAHDHTPSPSQWRTQDSHRGVIGGRATPLKRTPDFAHYIFKGAYFQHFFSLNKF